MYLFHYLRINLPVLLNKRFRNFRLLFFCCFNPWLFYNQLSFLEIISDIFVISVFSSILRLPVINVVTNTILLIGFLLVFVISLTYWIRFPILFLSEYFYFSCPKTILSFIITLSPLSSSVWKTLTFYSFLLKQI